jgi:hypothetical protein
MMAHGWTYHGHKCCGQLASDDPSKPRPAIIARCGGPNICGRCALDAAAVHAKNETNADR